LVHDVAIVFSSAEKLILSPSQVNSIRPIIGANEKGQFHLEKERKYAQALAKERGLPFPFN